MVTAVLDALSAPAGGEDLRTGRSATTTPWPRRCGDSWLPACYRAGQPVSPGDGGAWLDGDAVRAIVCDAMTVPVVTGDVDPGAIEDLIAACSALIEPNRPAPGRRRP
jgi:hypothetical protein